MSYRVKLPVFSGPLDLLLHLIKQQEVDIHEVSIAAILDQYLEHLNVLQTLDLADIGEFVVMASTLMEIKSRELLPRDEVLVEEELDPKDELIQRLLEYKRYRDLSQRFDRLWRRRARMMDVRIPMPEELLATDEGDDELDLGNVDVWSLTAAFARLLEETGAQAPALHFGVEKRNMRYYADRVLSRVRGGERVEFSSLFDPAEGRLGVIGVFTCVLELMKQGYLRAWQERCFAKIELEFAGPADLTPDDVLGGAIAADTTDEQGAA